MPYHLPSVYWRTQFTSAYLYPPALSTRRVCCPSTGSLCCSSRISSHCTDLTLAFRWHSSSALSVRGQQGKPFLSPFPRLLTYSLTSFSNHPAIYLHPQEVPRGFNQPDPHTLQAACGKISLHSRLENPEEPPKISTHSCWL